MEDHGREARARPQAEVDAEVKVALAAERFAERRERIAAAIYAAQFASGHTDVKWALYSADLLIAALDGKKTP